MQSFQLKRGDQALLAWHGKKLNHYVNVKIVQVDLRDFFSRFGLFFLTTPQSRPLAVNSAGRPRFTTIYNPERVILMTTIL